jgi:uncharacterized protein YrrD
MLYKATTLTGFKLNSLEGEIGKVKEFYFDDRFWTIRYLVADTGTWLTGRQVLISPYALGAVNQEAKNIAIELTKKRIEDSPPLESDKPVSRQFEESHFAYFGLSAYWNDLDRMGPDPNIGGDIENPEGSLQDKEDWDPNLRSTNAVMGHHVQASDDEIGHVEDFIIDDQTWAIRYLVINTRNWLPGKKILVSPQWIERVSWTEAKVFVNLASETIKAAPEYDDDAPITRDYEEALHNHFSCKGYWVKKPDDEKWDDND